MTSGFSHSVRPDRARILFAGSPEFAVPCLRVLNESAHEVIGVLTQPDRPAGRGRQLRPGPVKEYAVAHAIDVLQPERLSGAATIAELRSLQIDLAVIVAYGLLLPPAFLEMPRCGCINVHASILPRWRGASPIQAAILAGDEATGISIMQMEAGLDTGPVFATRSVEIETRDTTGSLHDRLAAAGSQLLLDTLPGILAGKITAVPQDAAAATYAPRINKADACIDWQQSAVDIDRQIRAYHAWPVGDTLLDGQRTRCWAARPVPEVSGDDSGAADSTSQSVAGQVIGVANDGIDVQTGNGVLRITELQLPGRQRMPASEFANGYSVLGKVLGQ
jgi:methionyl-tRNA formyltransferase